MGRGERRGGGRIGKVDLKGGKWGDVGGKVGLGGESERRGFVVESVTRRGLGKV